VVVVVVEMVEEVVAQVGIELPQELLVVALLPNLR
jgi:hypothetical protein